MRQWTVDAFARSPFRGNPACVVEPFDTWPSDAWMQSLAQENNQAETAFLLRTPDASRFGLRWFTPAVEVALCGHATLASAHVLFAELQTGGAAVWFETRSAGDLIVRRAAAGYEMDFPVDPPRPSEPDPLLAQALGARLIDQVEGRWTLVVVESEGAVRELKPDLSALARLGAVVCVAALADEGRDYRVISRFFAPSMGIPEDPTTGSAHCILAPYFSGRLGAPVLAFHQAFPGRGGDLECEMRGERVLIRGEAVTVCDSRLRL